MRAVSILSTVVLAGCAVSTSPTGLGNLQVTTSTGIAGDIDVMTYDEPGIATVAYDVGGEPIANIDVFFDQLDPYGSWYDDPTYGWVFAPAEPGYIPYANGSWRYTDYGLLWVSADPFGWATDHYGRWVFQNRWVWIPDTTWGPAWVTWRQGGGYIGWAPLGFTANAYIPETHWRFVIATDLFAIDLYRRYITTNHRHHLATSTVIARYHRHDRDVWIAGPSESWMRDHRIDPRRQHVDPADFGRFDARRRAELEARTREHAREWAPRHARDEDNRRAAAARAARQRDEQLRIVEEQRRQRDARNRADQDRRRLQQEEIQRRQAEEQRRALEATRQRAEQDRIRVREERRLQEEQRHLQDEQRRRAEDQRRLQDEQRRRADEDARRKADAQRRVQDEQRRRAEDQRRLQDEQRRRSDDDARRKADEQRRRADDDARRKADERRRRDGDRRPIQDE